MLTSNLVMEERKWSFLGRLVLTTLLVGGMLAEGEENSGCQLCACEQLLQIYDCNSGGV